MLNYSLALDTGPALGSQKWASWRDGKGCRENCPNPDRGEGPRGQQKQKHESQPLEDVENRGWGWGGENSQTS